MGKKYNWKCKVESSSCGNAGRPNPTLLFLEGIGVGTFVVLRLVGGFTITGRYQGIDDGYILIQEAGGRLDRINPRFVVSVSAG